MATHRIVQCFGTKVRPRKPAKPCRKKFLWTAKGSSAGNFGRKGIQACPSCGNLPEFQHPINRYLNNELTGDEAKAILKKDYDENWLKKAEAGT